MSSSGLVNTLVWAILIIVIIIIIFLVAERLIAHLYILQFAHAEQKEIGQETIDIGNNTDIKITCTSNIPNLVECD